MITKIAKGIITAIHGDKGGVGKSMTCAAYADRQMRHGRSIAIVDADQRNPDVYRMFDGHAPTYLFNLSSQDGWMDLTDLMAETDPGIEVILNLPAQVGGLLRDRRAAWLDDLAQLDRTWRVIWPLSRTPDSVGLLKVFMDDFGDDTPHILAVKNGFFGRDDQFFRWLNSQTRKRLLEQCGGSEAYMPELHERIADHISAAGAKPFSMMLDAGDSPLKFSDKSELRRWLSAAHSVFDALD